ncbi:hypothetical protein BgiMline_007497 [Biomphalaria glabrata]|uniref:Uncharacterized protein LOC106050149 n=1 Tax=Biomphalaria glabrata TaxID=6526 RepID=A0A9U8DUN0_BIOGL|nr:uncharacterized protein LOC106050149 [Biomphalaria glabrata]XP_013060549.2 uncharacterized protein LOC106050149 [Biomphalaria glabrata]KAI8788174.1 hypothetical protein BgiBS90_010842 [Biomphalaria glabrata]
MPKLQSGCLGYRRRRDSDFEEVGPDDDESFLVSRDEQDGVDNCFRPFTSQRNRGTEKDTANERTDLTGSRQRRKQKRKKARKEMRKRVGHAIHSSWKWFKRGVVALSPAMTSMLMFAPSPANLIQATVAAKREGNNKPTFL